MLYSVFFLFPPALTLLDIQYSIEPFEPYDIARLETVLEKNDTCWTVVVTYIDIDTNTTDYVVYIYDIESKTLILKGDSIG